MPKKESKTVQLCTNTKETKMTTQNTKQTLITYLGYKREDDERINKHRGVKESRKIAAKKAREYLKSFHPEIATPKHESILFQSGHNSESVVLSAMP
jgi:hypothetical protein